MGACTLYLRADIFIVKYSIHCVSFGLYYHVYVGHLQPIYGNSGSAPGNNGVSNSSSIVVVVFVVIVVTVGSGSGEGDIEMGASVIWWLTHPCPPVN